MFLANPRKIRQKLPQRQYHCRRVRFLLRMSRIILWHSAQILLLRRPNIFQQYLYLDVLDYAVISIKNLFLESGATIAWEAGGTKLCTMYFKEVSVDTFNQFIELIGATDVEVVDTIRGRNYLWEDFWGVIKINFSFYEVNENHELGNQLNIYISFPEELCDKCGFWHMTQSHLEEVINAHRH